MTVIYKISNKVNEKVYIGSAVNYEQRKNDHIKRLKSCTHHNLHLQRHINKYGIESLVFEIIQECDKSNLLVDEQYWIDFHKSKTELFNINMTAGSNLGRKFDKSTRLKISRARTGKCHLSAEQLEIRRKRMIGNTFGKLVNITPEYRIKQSNKVKGSKNGKAKINECIALLIKKSLLNGEKQSDIARQYGVSRFTVWAIKEKRQWI